MAEIVCPHCHSTMPRDGRFCPRCRSFIGSLTPGDVEPVAVGGRDVSVGERTEAEAKDVVGEAVKASMATSRRGSWDVLDELGDERDEPYPSDTEVIPREEPAAPPRKRPSGPSSGASAPGHPRKRRADAEPPMPPLARAVAWLVALPETTRTWARTLGAMPVTVFVVVLALLGSGGLLYAIGAFDEGSGEEQASRPIRVLKPASYKPSCAADPSVTSDGSRVTFGADHLFDGKTSTAWRCPGNGGKQRVTLTFANEVQVTGVALVPGWATKDKTSKANRFKENGAPTAVTWRFDDTAVKQTIKPPKPTWAERALAEPVTTKTLTLSIDKIRKGDRRTMVAISEIRVLGR